MRPGASQPTTRHHVPAPSRPVSSRTRPETFTRWSDRQPGHDTPHHHRGGILRSICLIFIDILIWFSHLHSGGVQLRGGREMAFHFHIGVRRRGEKRRIIITENWSCSINFSESPRVSKGDSTNKPSSMFMSQKMFWTISARYIMLEILLNLP